jgi:hypothetical protein
LYLLAITACYASALQQNVQQNGIVINRNLKKFSLFLPQKEWTLIRRFILVWTAKLI